MLVIDASNSMRGAPIADAMAAARVFADQRSPDQPLGVVTFNSRTETLLPLTTDAERIEEALAADPQLRRQTHVFDGVDAALAMLAGDEVTSGSVVVLSDGADTGSQIGLAEAGDRGSRSRRARLLGRPALERVRARPARGDRRGRPRRLHRGEHPRRPRPDLRAARVRARQRAPDPVPLLRGATHGRAGAGARGGGGPGDRQLPRARPEPAGRRAVPAQRVLGLAAHARARLPGVRGAAGARAPAALAASWASAPARAGRAVRLTPGSG